jgi:hypothetical protein
MATQIIQTGYLFSASKPNVKATTITQTIIIIVEYSIAKSQNMTINNMGISMPFVDFATITRF